MRHPVLFLSFLNGKGPAEMKIGEWVKNKKEIHQQGIFLPIHPLWVVNSFDMQIQLKPRH
jgi:hypothetical protein